MEFHSTFENGHRSLFVIEIESLYELPDSILRRSWSLDCPTLILISSSSEVYWQSGPVEVKFLGAI